MKYLSKLMTVWAMAFGIAASAAPATVTVDLATQLTQTQQRELVALLTQESAAVAERAAVGYLTKVLGQDASAYWTARLTLGKVTVDGLQAIHSKVHSTKLNRDEVLRLIDKDAQTSALVAALNITAGESSIDIQAGHESVDVAAALPKARNNNLTSAQAKALVRKWVPAASGSGTAIATNGFQVDLSKLDAFKKDLTDRAANMDPAADAQMENVGRVLGALERRGCSLVRANNTNGCDMLRAGVNAWILSDRFTESTAAANFEAQIIDNGLGHEEPARVQQGNANVLSAALQQGPSYWEENAQLDECYQGAVAN